MKKLILLITCFLFLQVNAQTKTFTGIITDVKSELPMELTVQKEIDSPEIMVFNFGALPTECYRYFAKKHELKSEYIEKKFTITYIVNQDKNYIEKITLIGDKGPVFEKDKFSTATCRAYDINGNLIAIMDNNTIYPIKDGKKQEDKAKAIQNKDEVCVKGNQCVKVKVESDGLVNLFYLPNITDKTPAIKIVGDKIYRTQKKNTDIDEYKEFYYFKGNKTHIALIAVITRMGMGH